jgi:hypothetical protein
MVPNYSGRQINEFPIYIVLFYLLLLVDIFFDGYSSYNPTVSVERVSEMSLLYNVITTMW